MKWSRRDLEHGLGRDGVELDLDSFPKVRRRDEAAFGEFRTAALIMERYDAMARAGEADVRYESPVDPPAGAGPS